MPSVFKTIQRAIDYNISYGLMERLNYEDLKAMIIEYTIRDFELEIQRREKDRLESKGINRRKATDEEIARLHGLS